MTISPGYTVNDELEQLAETAATAVGEIWGGGWVNPDGTITIGLTDTSATPSVLQHDKVHIVAVRHSTAELQAAHRRVVERLNALLAPGVEPGTAEPWPYTSGSSHRANVVKVTVDQEHEDKKSMIDAALADDIAAERVVVTYGEVPIVVQSCGPRHTCVPPFRGGTQVLSLTNIDCTLGFVMKDPVGRRAQSTASHCAESPWSHGGRLIGPTAANKTIDSGSVDTLIIKQDNENEPAPANWVYRAGLNNTGVAITTKISVPGASLEGTRLCLEGYVTAGTACGALTDWDGSFAGRCCFGRVAANACRGDSGGPTLNDSTNRAYGFTRAALATSSSDVCGTYGTIFTWLRYAEDALGYSLLVTPTSWTLAGGQQMPPGSTLKSTNGAYILAMQTDGNLVVYNCCGVALWHTNTYTHAGAFAVMQNDGNLVVYSPTRIPLWNRPGGGWVANSYLEMQNDGNLVIYTESRGVTWHRFGPNP